MNKLTEEEKSMIKYFWKEKGNLERYVEYPEVIKKLREEGSVIPHLWNNYILARDLLDMAIDDL